MSTRSQLTKDLNESVKALLGKHVKILLKNVVRLETKGDKTENRVLVFSPCRLFLLTAKVPTRIDCHFHYLEIESLESKRGNQLTIGTSGDKTYSFLTGEDSACSSETDAMIAALATAVRNIFPGVPLARVIRRVEVLPAERLPQDAAGTNPTTGGPCGGFSTQYACMCDYHGLPYRDEVAWDVDTIYLSHDARELCLRDFEHLETRDLVPIVSALEHNAWFECLRAGGCARVPPEALERVLHVMRRTCALERLHLEQLGLRHEFAAKLAQSVAANEASPLHTLDLSSNVIEDKGLLQLTKPLARLPKGLVHLNISGCGVTAKGVNALATALHTNPTVHTSLTYLNLSGNNLRDEINSLHNFLAQPNAIAHLDLSSTDTVLESLFGALLRGCSTNLVHLNVSRNPFSASKKTKEVPPSFKQFFMSTLCLKHLNMSGCRLPQEALKNLLLGLACNESTTDMELDLSSCALGLQGAHVLESCVHGVRCISTLDVADNALDADLAGVITAVGRNKSLKHVNVGRNLTGCKAKHVAAVVDALVQCIQEDDCVLQTLRLADGRLKQDVYALLNALGSNKCLRELDISGNAMGDGGARLLAKALQINTRLHTVHLDRNQLSLQGYADLAYALEKNYTLRHVPFPVHDALASAKQSVERTDQLMRRIQQLLQRNVGGRSATRRGAGAAAAAHGGGQAYRLQHGFLLSGAQQLVDRLVVQTQDTIRSLAAESCDQNDDINRATQLVQDADNSKHLLLRLRDCVRRDELETRLERCAGDMHAAVIEHLERVREAMLECAREQCPHVLASPHLLAELRRACTERSQLPEEWTKETVVRSAGADLLARVAELQLTVAAHVSDRLTDEVIEALSRTYKTLAGDMNRNRPGTAATSTGGASPSRSRLGSSSGRDDLSIDSQTSDQSPVLEYLNLATPHLSVKRKSLHGRRLRPKSVVDAVEGLSADDIPSRLSPGGDTDSMDRSSGCGGEESLDSVSELPVTAGGQQLQHLVKGRPRRAKTRAPTRPMLRAVDAAGPDEGLDVFWRPGSTTPTGARSPAGDPPTAETTPVLNEHRKLDTPRSRSEDSLGRSPLAARRSPPPATDLAAGVPRSASEDTPNAPRPWSLSDVGEERDCVGKPVAAPRKFLPVRREVTSGESAVRRSRLLPTKGRVVTKQGPLDTNHNLDEVIDV